MKICTTCGGSFEEDVLMCPNDGTPLFASAVAVEDDPDEVETSTQDDAAILDLPPEASDTPDEAPPAASDDADHGAEVIPEVETAEEDDSLAAVGLEDQFAEAVAEFDEAVAETQTPAPIPHTNTEEIVANLLSAEDPATPNPDEAGVEVADVMAPPEDPLEDSSELPEVEVEPLPELDPIPGPEITDAPTPVPDDSPMDSVLDLIEDSIADDSAIHRIPDAQEPVSLDDAASKKVVIPAKVEPKSSGGNKAIMLVAVVLVVAILGAVGYFFILPLLGG